MPTGAGDRRKRRQDRRRSVRISSTSRQRTLGCGPFLDKVPLAVDAEPVHAISSPGTLRRGATVHLRTSMSAFRTALCAAVGSKRDEAPFDAGLKARMGDRRAQLAGG